MASNIWSSIEEVDLRIVSSSRPFEDAVLLHVSRC